MFSGTRGGPATYCVRVGSFRRSYIPSRDALDGGLNAVVRHAAAQRTRHAFANLLVGWMRVLVEQRLGRHDLAVLAEAALRHLLLDPRLLQRMQLAVFRQPFQRGDFASAARRRRPARAHRGAVDDDRARPALAKTTAEPRPLQAEIVAKNVE